MRIAELLVELLLAKPPITGARAHAYIYSNPKTLDDLTQKQLKDEADEVALDRALHASGGNALVVDVNNHKARILGPNPEDFWKVLQQRTDVTDFWKRAVTAERAARTREANKEKELRWADSEERKEWAVRQQEKARAKVQKDWERSVGGRSLGAKVQPAPNGGLAVVSLTPGGPLERAGVLPGSILRSFGGVPLKGVPHFHKLVSGALEGTYRVRYESPDGATREVTVMPERLAR